VQWPLDLQRGSTRLVLRVRPEPAPPKETRLGEDVGDAAADEEDEQVEEAGVDAELETRGLRDAKVDPR